MPQEDLTPYRHNQAIKARYRARGLRWEEAIPATPFDLDLENWRLISLLDFVEAFEACGRSQEAMEACNNPFPPIHPMISPQDDWYRFKLWLEGEALSKPLPEQIGIQLSAKPAAEMSDAEIETELDRLLDAMKKAGIGIALVEGLPPRLFYTYLLEMLQEDDQLMTGGGWVIDGCSGYCPECVQRPWCNNGQELCWPEDEEAQGIHFVEALKDYVSPSPHSLELLRKSQREYDERMKKYMTDGDEIDRGADNPELN
jgi:hypothetical protein